MGVVMIMLAVNDNDGLVVGDYCRQREEQSRCGCCARSSIMSGGCCELYGACTFGGRKAR
ncbi:MAG: hypothetical protein MAG794_00113 [Gammaproteobacteria bacterium]|nr:hypothetical protein [Gammaproteobacteria bacterium]